MLALPMRSQDSSPNRAENDLHPQHNREPSPQTEELRKQVAGAMLSVMPPTRPPAPKRPKLSLQTSIPQRQWLGPALTLSATDSPTKRNTRANALDPPPPTPSSAVQPQVSFPLSSSPQPTSTTSSVSSPSTTDPSPQSINPPYTLPIGTHSILRNSPLPQRRISAASTYPCRRMFLPVKHVAFRDSRLTETLPTPLIETSSSSPGEEIEENEGNDLSEEEQQRRREEIQAEDGHATPGRFRRKRRREWIWRPLDDDVLMEHVPGEEDFEDRQERRVQPPESVLLPDSAAGHGDDSRSDESSTSSLVQDSGQGR